LDLVWTQLSWLDYVLLILIALGAYRGFRSGFVRAFLGLVALVVAFPLAGILTPSVSDFLQRQWAVAERMAAFLSEHIALPASLGSMELTDPVSVTQLIETLSAQHLPEPYLDTLGSVFGDLTSAAISYGAQTVGDFVFCAMALILLNTLVFLVLFSIIRGIINLIAAGSTRRMGLGFIGFSNRMAGLVFGVATVTAGIAVFLGLVAPFLGLSSLTWFAQSVSASVIGRGLLRAFYLVSPWIVQGQTIIPR